MSLIRNLQKKENMKRATGGGVANYTPNSNFAILASVARRFHLTLACLCTWP